MRSMKTKVESVASEDKETGLDVEAWVRCGGDGALEGELRRGRRVCAAGKQWI